MLEFQPNEKDDEIPESRNDALDTLSSPKLTELSSNVKPGGMSEKDFAALM